MPISAALASIYSFSDQSSEIWEALVLSHSTWGHFYIGTYHEPVSATFDGATQTFQPYPFEIVMPTRDGNGQQDLSIAIANVGNLVYETLDKAIAVPTEHIRARYTVYILGNTAPQIDPAYELTLTNVTAKELTVTGTATRYNVHSLAFPGVRYTPSAFPGIARR